MKKFMKAFAFVAIALVSVSVLVSCNGGDSKTAGSGTYLNTFLGAQPNTLDPSKGTDLYGNSVLLNILEPLVRFSEKAGGIIGAGAEKWDVSADGKTYTFHIRKNMKWTDGQPLTAKDYMYGIVRSCLPETACPYAQFMYPIVNGAAVVKGDKASSELGVEAPDDYTLVINLEAATPYFLDTAMQRTYFPQRKDWVEKYGDTYATSPETSPQCGAFILKSWTINSLLNFVKNKDFWNASHVKLDTINCQIINDTNTIYNSLLSGSIDLAGVSDPKWQAKFTDTTKWTHVEIPQADTVYWMINIASPTGFMGNVKIRRAISAALNREELIATCRHNIGLAAYWFAPPAVTCQGLTFNTIDSGAVHQLVKDVPDPKALFDEGLKEMGYTGKSEDVVIKLLLSGVDQESRTEAEYIQQIMKERLGCTFDTYNKDWNEFINMVQVGDYDIASLAWGADFNDPCNFLETCYSPTAAYPTGWVNKDFDALIEKAQQLTDAEGRREALLAAENILINTDCAIIPVTTRVSHSYRAAYVEGASTNYFNWMGWQELDTSKRGK